MPSPYRIDDSNLFQSEEIGPPTSYNWRVGNVIVDAAGNIFRCTVSGSPGSWAQLQGGSGSVLRNGEGAPTNAIGSEGDFYIDTLNKMLYGPCVGTAPAADWTIHPPTSLVGPAGADGMDGADGADGAPGAPGAPGANGADGADGADGAAGAGYVLHFTDSITPNYGPKSFTLPVEDMALTAYGVGSLIRISSQSDINSYMVGLITVWEPGTPLMTVEVTYMSEMGAPRSDWSVYMTGYRGDDGATGADGADGAPGAEGPPGPPGADGADGLDGAPGADGAPGFTILTGTFAGTGFEVLDSVTTTDGDWEIDLADIGNGLRATVKARQLVGTADWVEANQVITGTVPGSVEIRCTSDTVNLQLEASAPAGWTWTVRRLAWA